MVVKLHTHWRDCREWRHAGLTFTTTSDAAVKLYDAALTQFVGWYDDDSVGGIEKTVTDLKAADPNFAMGQVMSIGLDLMGTARTTRLDASFREELDQLERLQPTLGDREKKHVHAVKLWSAGQCKSAALVWEDILSDHPLDMLALKFAHDHYFYYGQQRELRDTLARVMPHWTSDMPLYGYLMGMYSFGLCETSMLAEAEPVARTGLAINAQDAWSTHSLAHVLEMQGRAAEGIKFMSSTVGDWVKCGMLACHNFWHWALYHIDQNEHQAAVDIFDNEISQRSQSGAMLDIVDACSMLYRLEMEGITVGQARWEQLYEVVRPHQDEHVMAFNDVHLLMAYLGTKKPEVTSQLMDSIRKYVDEYPSEDNAAVTRTVGLTLCEALRAYDAGDYACAVERLLPHRYSVVTMGGSEAQRDMFHLFLIHAAMRSTSPAHHKLCRNLIHERQAQNPKAKLTQRLMARWVAQHGD